MQRICLLCAMFIKWLKFKIIFIDIVFFLRYNHNFNLIHVAGVAQLVELLPCKQWVGGSSPFTSSIFYLTVFDQILRGEILKWLTRADCKSAGFAYRGSNPRLTTTDSFAGVAQLARASAFQAEGRGSEPRFPLHLILYWELFLYSLLIVFK